MNDLTISCVDGNMSAVANDITGLSVFTGNGNTYAAERLRLVRQRYAELTVAIAYETRAVYCGVGACTPYIRNTEH